MGKQAKIQIDADITKLRQSVKTAENLVQGLGAVEIDPKFAKQFKESVEKEINQLSSSIQREMKSIRESMETGAKDGAFSDEGLKKDLSRLAALKRELKEVQKIKDQLGSDGVGGSGRGGSGGSGGGIGGPLAMGGRLGKMIGSGMATLGVGLGAGLLFQRQRGISNERLNYLSLSGGTYGNEESRFGFTPQERRARFASVSRAAGRDLSSAELNQMADLGEMAQRAYGISESDQESAMTAARRTGSSDTKFFAGAMGSAVAAGLEGSKVGEFLQAMTQSLESMADGVDINSESLLGFAGALSSLPFFSSDPRRAAAMAGDLNEMFKGGDRYQQILATRSINQASGVNDPAATEFRRGMGIFANVDEQTMKDLKERYGEDSSLVKVLGADPQKIVKNLFDGVMADNAGLGESRQAFALQSALKIDHGAALALMAKGGMPDAKLMKTITNAQKSPEEKMADAMGYRMEKTFKNFDGSMAKLGTKIEMTMDKMAADLGAAVLELDSAVDLNTDQLKFVGEAVMALTAVLAVKGGLDALAGGAGAGGAGAAGSLLRRVPSLLRRVPTIALGLTAIGTTRNAISSYQDPDGFEKDLAERTKDRGILGNAFHLADTVSATGALLGKMTPWGQSAMEADDKLSIMKAEERQEKVNKARYGMSNLERDHWTKAGKNPYAEAYRRGTLPEGSQGRLDQKTRDAIDTELGRARGGGLRKESSATDAVQTTSENTNATDLNTQALERLTAAIAGGRSGAMAPGGIPDRRPTGVPYASKVG